MGVGYNARVFKYQAGILEYWLEFNNEKVVEITEKQYREMRELIRCYHNWHEKKWSKIADSILEFQERIKELEAIFDHPNHTLPKKRYLYMVKQAILLLRKFSELEGGGELAFGVAMELEQFYKRAKTALKGE